MVRTFEKRQEWHREDLERERDLAKSAWLPVWWQLVSTIITTLAVFVVVLVLLFVVVLPPRAGTPLANAIAALRSDALCFTYDPRVQPVQPAAPQQLALSRCAKMDECKSWADKAEALSSYAKQANDNTLHRLADRIQARAIRREGELLEEIEAATNQHDISGGAGAAGGISRNSVLPRRAALVARRSGRAAC